MPELMEIMGDLPPELLTDEPAGDATRTTQDQDDEDENADTDDQNTEDDTDGSDGADAGDDPDTDEDEDGDEDEDYVASVDYSDTTQPPKPATPEETDENTFILKNLPKIQTRVIVPGPDGKDQLKTVEVYGWGQMPQDMKGFATEYERGIFTQAVNAQELKARELQQQFRQQKLQADTDAYIKKENLMIGEDLTELRQEGIFPKFKGMPGSKEFNESAGAKEFDRVIAFMNEQNDHYGRAANSGKAFRHIGFREAFIMLNGPNTKAAEKRDMQGRRAAAERLKTGTGANKTTRNVQTKRVSNLNDLQDEFSQFIGNKA